jgi:hypothetical protein
MTGKSIEKRLANLWARSSDTELIKSLRTLDSGPRNPETNWARSQVIKELERRYPAASDAVDTAFDHAADDEYVDYVAVLLSAISEASHG